MHVNEDTIRALGLPPKGAKTHFLKGVIEGKPTPRGFGIQATAAGAKSWCLVYRDADGKQRRETIGRWPLWSCVKAARQARTLRQALDRGEAIGKVKAEAEKAEKGSTVADVVDAFMKHEGRDLRTSDEYRRIFGRYVKPAIGELGVYELKRSHIATMLDGIREGGLNSPRQRGGGKGKPRGPAPVMANRVRSRLSSALAWWADERDDDFTNPLIIRRRRGTKRKEQARERWLTEHELFVLWSALKRPTEGQRGTHNEAGERLPCIYPAFIKTLLLTACRRSEVAGMHERELSIAQPGNKHGAPKGQWLWEIPAERYKTNVAHVVPLSRQTVTELQGLGVKPGGKRYVFSTDGGETAFSGYSKAFGVLTMRMAQICWKAETPEVPHWTLHDLRRTARTMLSSLKVDNDTAERVLGHKIGGVAGVYDRFAYLGEKRDALQKLADEVDRIVGW